MNDFQPKPFGKFFLIEKLAMGGMAEIYKAKTFGVDGFEKLLAIKRILPHCSTDKEFIGMLIDEAKLSVLLSHTNIAQVFDLGKVGEDYFISMEFVDGVNLREVMNRCKELHESLPEEIAVYIVSEICKGLDYAHSKKDLDGNPLQIVHRDISPQNMLISYEGEVKIVDFGIAKAAMNISQTVAGILKGKITYMSPEQALGKPVDYKTDIYSIGIVLYELLTGKKLFSGETQFEVLKKIRSTRITENLLPETIHPGLRKIIARALAYSSKDRFDNAGDMQIELTKFLYSTYLDFSPRKLANLIKKLFANEIQNKKIQRKDDLTIDAKTRSILLDAERQQNIVHREEGEKTAIDIPGHQTLSSISNPIPAESSLSSPSIGVVYKPEIPVPSYTGSAPLEKKSKKPLYFILFLLICGFAYLGYRYFNPASHQGEKLGTVVVNSVPQGAKIFLNDKDTNLLTPSTLQKLELSLSQKITLKKEKFKEWTRLVTLISTQPLQLEATLDTIPSGTVSISTHPEGAKIFIDGKDSGLISPVEVPDLELNKTYTLRLEKQDYRPIEERITLYSIEAIKYEKKLEEIKYGSIEVKSSPPGAKIYLNGDDTQLNTPNQLPKLEVGKSYTVRLMKAKYRDIFRTIQITNEKPIILSEKMLTEEEIKKRDEEEKRRQEKLKAEAENRNQIKNPPDNPLKNTEKPATGTGYIAVNSNPSGADVFVNGERKGSTSGTFQVPAGKPVEITITKSGSGKITKIVTLKPGETRSLGTIDLGNEFGSIRVESTPEGASVSVNGKPTGGKTPVIVKGIRRGKDYSITIELNGYETWSRSITMDEDKKTIMATLRQK